MSDHSHPQTVTDKDRAELRDMSLAGLSELMEECEAEPADFSGCLACAAYEEYQRRSAPAKTKPAGTMVPHPNGDSPEQIAADLLRAAFSALSAVPPRQRERHRNLLADAQDHVSKAFVNLSETWPVT